MTDEDLGILTRGIAPVIKDAIARATDPLLARIAALEARSPVAGRDGRDGQPGTAGLKGDPGERGEVGPAGPAGTNGRDGADGQKGLDGAEGPQGPPGAAGAAGPKGEQGVSGDTGPQGPAGADGRDGRDGIDFTPADLVGLAFDVETRSLVWTFARDGVTKTWPIKVPLPIYRGLWSVEKTYESGDMVTWSGSQFIALEETAAQPGTAKTWQLTAKRGRDGKVGPKGPEGERGPKGEKGDRGPDRW